MTSGIYKIVHSSGNFYVGSTVNFKNRKASHWSEMRKLRKKGLWLKLLCSSSIDQFSFEIIEVVEAVPSLLISRENFWLSTLKPTLNLSPEASFRPYQYGSANPASKHEESKIIELFKTIAESPWKSLAEIDRKLGFCKGTAWKARAGARYAHIENVIPEIYELVVSGRYQTLYLISPKGDIKEFTGTITSIARCIGVHDTHLFDLFYNKVSHAKGWRIYDK